MSNEITIENARTNYIRIVSDYEKETAAAAKEIDFGVKELEKLGVKDPLNNLSDLIKDKDKNKKKFVECIKKAQLKVDEAAASLQTNLSILTLVPNSPPDAVEEFQKWLRKTIEERSVMISKYAKLKLQGEFKKTKFQGAGVDLIWNFKKF